MITDTLMSGPDRWEAARKKLCPAHAEIQYEEENIQCAEECVPGLVVLEYNSKTLHCMSSQAAVSVSETTMVIRQVEAFYKRRTTSDFEIMVRWTLSCQSANILFDGQLVGKTRV